MTKSERKANFLVSAQATQIWALRHYLGHLVPPALDDDGTASFLAWSSEEDAIRGLKFQISQGYVEEADCRIIQLK